MNLGFAIATLGRPEAVRTLLGSLQGQLDHDDWIVISAVTNSDVIKDIVDQLDFGSTPVVILDGPQGASAGRNFAVENAPTSVDFILFPNDTSTYPIDFVREFKSQAVAASAGALTVVDEFGPKFVLPPGGAKLNKKNVWSVIEPGLFVGHAAFRLLGGFDESIGTGAMTPWQSGEGTELLLRWMQRFPNERFQWMNLPLVYGISDPHGLSKNERRIKLRAYARGYGRLLITGKFGLMACIKALVGASSFGIRKGRPYQVLDGAYVLLGRIEGILGSPVAPTSSVQAVNK